MKLSPLWIACLTLAALSCTDQGNVVNYLEVLEVNPAPNSSGVDKAALVSVHFDRNVSVNEAAKILLRYVDGTDPVNSYVGFGLTPPLVTWLAVGPFIWKPGRTVEVTIPKEIADPNGNALKQSIVYRFTIAQDTVPFDLVDTQPAQNGTLSLGSFPHVLGSLTFSDYVYIRDSTLTIDPPATLFMNPFVIVDGRNSPSRQAFFDMSGLLPNSTYTITIPARIADYEGQTLPHDYHLVFHTVP